jgi:uncharacterized membrane protein YfcA
MHKFFLIIFTIILGIVSGLVGGGLGLGTTTIALPVFAFLFNNVKTAIGTTLIASPFSWPSVYVYYKEGHADILLGIIDQKKANPHTSLQDIEYNAPKARLAS